MQTRLPYINPKMTKFTAASEYRKPAPHMLPLRIRFFLLFFFALFSGCQQPQVLDAPITLYPQNPSYWQINSQPVLLLGGSVEDNLFQSSDLANQLDLLQQAGGNYVRNTMSSRDEGNLWPYQQDASGMYDLNQPNEAYWNRVEQFLSMTAERGIVVQIEVWATFDFYDDRNMRRGFWQLNPFNPKNNVNYTAELSGLPEIVASHPTQTENPFFYSVPSEQNNTLLLGYQQDFVDRLLSLTLSYGHVLYCMDNETSVSPAWGAFWATYIKAKADEAGKWVQTTEMWDPWDLAHEMHSNTFDHPETYSFIDISQNNHQTGQAHWDNAQLQRKRILDSGIIRPLNNVKIYGAEGSRFGSERDGIERFWRNILGGMASARFHRPESGLGLGEVAQAHLRSARLFTMTFDVFQAEPTLDILQDREENEAYAMAIEGKSYAVFFTNGGSVKLEIPSSTNPSVRWLNIQSGTWVHAERPGPVGHSLSLQTPDEGYWLAVVEL